VSEAFGKTSTLNICRGSVKENPFSAMENVKFGELFRKVLIMVEFFSIKSVKNLNRALTGRKYFSI